MAPLAMGASSTRSRFRRTAVLATAPGPGVAVRWITARNKGTSVRENLTSPRKGGAHLCRHQTSDPCARASLCEPRPAAMDRAGTQSRRSPPGMGSLVRIESVVPCHWTPAEMGTVFGSTR